MDISPLKEKILSYLSTAGPSLPLQIGKIIGRDSFWAGAILSDLMEGKKVKMSHAKIGGSPVYYLPGQEARLNILYQHLPQKEREAYDLLRQKTVLFANEVEPAIRVALQSIRDFALPIQDGSQTGWKWYLAPDVELATHSITAVKTVPLQQTLAAAKPVITENKTAAIEQPPTKLKKTKAAVDGEFEAKIREYLQKHNLPILSIGQVRKNREMSMMVGIDTPIGQVEALIVAKNKKTISQQDLLLAQQKNHGKGLVIFLTTGNIGKQALQYMEKHLKGSMIVKKL